MSISKVRKGHIKNTTYILNKVNIKRHFIVDDVGSFLPKANYNYQGFGGSWYYNGNVEFSSAHIDRKTSSITLTHMFCN